MNNKYNKIQKFISYLLIFSILFTQSISINFLWFITQIFAWNENRINLVSILVEDSKYDELKNSIDTYAKNIQNTLENTRVVIVPTPSNANPYTIASINEKMFFEWYKWIDWQNPWDTRLIWTVLVWDIPLPVVHKFWSYEKTILPYVDFENKEYIYDPVKQVFEYNNNNSEDFKREIWHWYIGWTWVSVNDIKNYFEKNNDYYKWKWLFKTANWITNQVYQDDYIDWYEPHVFYFDQIRENEAIKEVEYKAYKLYLENLEDISYNRFYKLLADKLQNTYLTFQWNFVWDISNFLFQNWIDPSKYNLTWNKADISWLVPDIQTRHIIYNSVKRFYQIFNSTLFEDYRKNIYNAWRYNFDEDKINGDFIPFIITNLDLYTDWILKNVNNDLEEYIDNLVIWSWSNKNIEAASRKIAIPTYYSLWYNENNSRDNFTNYYHWLNWSSVKEAIECSIYRWSTYNSWNLVESNRWFNINNAWNDTARCQDKTTWFWWKNSPIDLDINSINEQKWKLSWNDLKKATESLFDNKWSVSNTPWIKNPDPRLCFDLNFILSDNINCSTVNNNFKNDWYFEKAYKNWTILPSRDCETHTIFLDWKNIKTQDIEWCDIISDSEWNILWEEKKSTKYIHYKLIDSHIIHKSPTAKELKDQISHMATPNLQIDRDRYIDYISRNWSYQKINYPYFYRVKIAWDNLSLSWAKIKVKNYLEEKTNYVNKILDDWKPVNFVLTHDNTKTDPDWNFFYEKFYKKWPYPSWVDLYNYIKSKPDTTFSLLWNSKKVKYLDTVEFAVFWKSIESVPAKYKFIMEYYLSDRFLRDDIWFLLPKNRKQYEMSYIWAPWDPKNMYIKVDPESKLENPYQEIITKNIELDSILLWNKTWYSNLYSDLLNQNWLYWWWNWNNSKNWNRITSQDLANKKQKELEEKQSKCWPPEWVPIWEWMWAITCRLQNMLPPKITINEWNCWYSLSNYDYDNLWESNWYLWDNWEANNNANYINYNFTDDNKNWVNDLLEKALSWNISLDFWEPREDFVFKNYYNKTWNIDIKLLDKDGNLIYFDSVWTLSWELVKLTIPKDLNEDISETNKKVIFDKLTIENSDLNSKEARDEAMNYFWFKDYSTKIQNWKWNISYSSMWTDADATIRVTYTIKDKDKNIVKTIFKDYQVQIRWNLFFSQTHKLSVFDWELLLDSWDNYLKASDKDNIFIWTHSWIILSSKENLNNKSNSPEKLFISLLNKDKKWNDRSIKYNLKYNILNQKWISYASWFISSLDNFKSFSIKDAWVYNIEIIDIIWNTLNQEITVLPSEKIWEAKIQLWTNIMETWWAITTNVLSITDEFSNAYEAQNLKVDLEIKWSSIVFDDWSLKQSFNLNERFKLFRIKSTSQTWISKIKATIYKNENEKINLSENINVVNNLDINVNIKSNDLKVWWWKYEFDVSINTSNNYNFNSRVYLRTNKLYISWPSDAINIKNNKWTWYFSTTTLAWENIKLEFKAEWLKNPKYITIDIKPDVALKVFLNITKPNIEAKKWNLTEVIAELKDRYWNIVWTENTSWNLTIDEKYKSILKGWGWINFISWKAKINLEATDIPGTAYFKVEVPSVLSNSIKIWNKTISWVWENTWKIETFYFWNKQKINNNKYNSIYTTLLLSNYWDITIKDNLANSIIFDKNNRWLSITSLLSPPSKNLDVINIKPSWKVELVNLTNDLWNDISTFTSISWNNLNIEFFNNTLSTKIWIINYNLWWYKSIKCEDDDFDKCLNKQTNSIWVYTNKKLDNNELWFILRDDNWWELLKIESWKIIKDSLIILELDEQNDWDYLLFNIKKWISNIWKLVINAKDKFSINLDSSWYSLKRNYIWNSTKDNSWYTISYNEDYNAHSEWLNEFSISFEDWYENFYKNKNVWWELWNKTLLSFAAWKSVWEATKDYQSFWLINIWDPVVSLKKLKRKIPWTQKDARFDKTIWSLLSKDEKNKSFWVLDYNNDNKNDILILKSDKFVNLLEWTNDIEYFIDRKNLVHIPDIIDDDWWLKIWDFTWDNFDDFIVLNNKRKVVLFDNNKKDFKRIDLDLVWSWSISQIETFDMNKDWKTDIVALDDAWNIYNFYGTSDVWKFDKKLVDSWQWIKIDPKPRKDNSSVYFDWLHQLKETFNWSTWSWYRDRVYLDNLVKESQNLLSRTNSNINNTSQNNSSTPSEFNEDAINKMIFEVLSYTPLNSKSLMNQNLAKESSEQSKQTIIDTVPQSPWHWANFDRDWLINFIWNDFKQLNPGNVYYDVQTNNSSNTTFIKSEYSEYEWVKVEKTFTDLSWNPLRSNDLVLYKASFKNISTNTLKNVALTDIIPKEFSIKNFEKISISWEEIKFEDMIFKSWIWWYDFLIDSYNKNWSIKSITLTPWQEVYYEIKLETKPFSYWHIDIWYFDDKWNSSTSNSSSKENDPNIFPDILLSSNKYNCWSSRSKYISNNWTSYNKIDLDKTCSIDSWSNSKDLDNNWVPDYIDNLSNSANNFWNWSWDSSEFEKYSKDALSDMAKDSDWDWIPDYEDVSPDYNWETWDFLNSIDSFNQDVGSLLYWLDRVLAWLNCWFWSVSCKPWVLNWAPLATWQDPTFLWTPLWDWLKVAEWMPVFSTINWKRVWKKCLPLPWPPRRNLPWCVWSWAWWRLWTFSPTNYFRIFVTPTLTWRVWYEICYWAPAAVAWVAIPPWLSPFVPWWNCIVWVLPTDKCKNDWSDWKIYKKWNWKTIINWNTDKCISQETSKEPYLWDAAQKYIWYKKTWNWRDDAINALVDSLWWVARWWTRYRLPNSPLLVVWDWNSWEEAFIDFDFNSVKKWNFEDVLKIEMPRISPINDYVMDWVTRQTEEIANKLTDFPTMFVVLPDFNWPYDTKWANYPDKIKKLYQDVEKKQKAKEDKISAEMSKLNTRVSRNNQDSWIKNIWSEMELMKLETQKSYSSNKTVAWVKTAYEFLSNIPILNINPQRVNVNIPWVDLPTLTKEKSNFESTKKAWEAELARVKNDTANYSSWITSAKQQENEKIVLNANKMISSIDRNLAIIEEYKKTPEKLYKMLKAKEVYLEQTLCNVETISKYLPAWIWLNGKRFKAWVELYILIKAILKSWQLILDIFYDYDTRCHQCKNERHDLMYFTWKLISMTLPKIPVIKFPKWPDIYLDLHNVRMLLNLTLPEFNFNLRPIVFPSLTLPTWPNLTANLPALPTLPIFPKLPELPDLPTLPSVDLPDLPPPPRLPKLLWSISRVLDVLKLVTKAMCILKTSPFVPEWRAWDQIAYISERKGYLPIDFLSTFASYPQFSLPFVDSIRIKSWINAEMEADFISEMARNATLPLNSFTNDAIRVINSKTWNNIDLSNSVPKEINTSVDKNWNTNTEIYFKQHKNLSFYDFVIIIWKSIDWLVKDFEKIWNEEITNSEFKEILNNEVLSLSDKKEASQIVETLKNASNYSFKKEDKLIQDLIDGSNAKFDELKSILEEEKIKTEELKKDLQEKFEKWKTPTNILSSNIIKTEISSYNSRLEPFNEKAISSFEKMINWWEDAEVKEIKETSKNLLSQVKAWLDNYKKSISINETNDNKMLSYTQTNSILTNSTTTNTIENISTSQNNNEVYNTSCEWWQNWDGFVYKWIYIVEDIVSQISYKLFDYIDELSWDEASKEYDFEWDNDKEIIYMVWNEIFIKKDLTIKKTKNHYPWNPIVLDFKEYFDNYFIWAVNWFEEDLRSINNINIWFDNSLDPKVSNYRIEIFDLVDKYSNVLNDYSPIYTPWNVKRYVIDAFRDIDDITLNMEDNNSEYITRKNLWYITSISASVDVFWYKLNNLKNNISASNKINISAWTKLYAWKDSISISYYKSWEEINETWLLRATILKNTNIEFKEDIIIVSLNWNLYVDSWLKWKIETKELFDEPLLPWFTLSTKKENWKATIKYFDWNELSLDFSKDKYYEIHDLWYKEDRYNIRTKLDIDYYYGHIKAFKWKTYSSYANQILLSPQKYNDKTNPEISWFNLRVPVYQEKNIDISEYLYDNAWISSIEDIYIDFDLDKDTSMDLENTNDRDFFLWDNDVNKKIKINKEWWKVVLKLWKFDDIFTKKALIYATDSNQNTWVWQITITSYSPTPSIESYLSWSINGWLDENLVGEPISIYRVRSWNIKRLETTSNKDSVPTLENYKYIFWNFKEEKWLSFTSKSWSINEMSNEININEYFKIDETTWKISINSWQNISYRVLPTNDKTNDKIFPKIILSKWWKDIYYQYFSFPKTWKVNILSDISEIKNDIYNDKIWVYYIHNNISSYNYFSMPLNIDTNPWDLFIYDIRDDKKTPIIKIYKDWRIELIWDRYSLKYWYYDKYVKYELLDWESKIWDILLKPDENFIIR